MEPHKLARVRWQVGQTLLPEHFQTQEAALADEARLHAELAGLPRVGIGLLDLNKVLLADGNLTLSALTAIMPGGTLVEVPGNAALSPFSLAETGLAEVSVYLHLLKEPRVADHVPLYKDDPPAVRRTLHCLLLSNRQAVEGVVSSLPLGTYVKDTQGKWHLSEEDVPPLLLVGPNPFLDKLLVDLDSLLHQAQGQIRTHIQDSFQRKDRVSEARRALCAVRRLQALRADMRHQVYPHPYRFFDALREFYFEAICYLDAEPSESMPTYEHDDLGPGLRVWMELLTGSFRPQATRLTHRAFVARDGRFSFSGMPREELPPNDFYLLVRRKDLHQAPSMMRGVKLASPSRLSVVHRLALKGITYQHLDYPKFPHSFGPEVAWYRITAQGEEWESALREDGLALFSTSELEGAELSLFWRRE